MAEHDEWTAADDARLRAALTSLRADVEATPLPDVRFVKARGMARRRRRFLTVGAAAAAAVVVAGTVGYAQLGSDPVLQPVPADRSGTTTAAPSPTTTSSLDQPGVLPLKGEWESSLDLPASSVRLVQATTLEGGVECADALGRPTLQQSVTQANSPVTAAATYWETGGDKAKAVALEQSVAKCQQGPDFKVTSELVGNFSIYSYGAGDAGSGWFAVVSGGQGVELLQLIDPAFPDVKSGGFTEDELSALASLAQARLDRYADGGPATPTTPSSTGGPKAINEKMAVSGPDPVPSSNLFVAASQWADPLFAKGAKAYAGAGSPDSTDMGLWAPCDTSGEMSGLGGQFGVVEIHAGTGDANTIGRQRVLVDESAETSARKAWAKQTLATYESLIVKSCTAATGTVSVTPGPHAGTYLVTTAVTQEATGEVYDFIGVTTGVTPGLLTTVNFSGTNDGQGFQGTPEQGFAQLDRLLALARQK